MQEFFLKWTMYLKVEENKTINDLNYLLSPSKDLQPRRFENNVNGDGWKLDMNAVIWQEIREMKDPRVEIIPPTKSFYLYFN